MSTTSTAPVQAFFEAFGKGDYQGLLNAFHPDVTITAVHAATRSEGEIYGTYRATAGVEAFLSNLSKTFDTQSFSIENIVGENNVAFANGKFVHKLKSTGKLFPSDWALYAVIKDEKIFEYHFYEDSAAFVKANG